jgi:hypothetical protein
MKLLTGYAGYATPTQRGFYPENILNWFPVVSVFFYKYCFFNKPGNSYSRHFFKTSMQWLEIINVIMIIPLLLFFLASLFRKKPSKIFLPEIIFIIGSIRFYWPLCFIGLYVAYL